MSRFLFVPIPVTGHMMPALALARGVVGRGHHVTFYTGERFRTAVERTGSRHEPFRRALDAEMERLNDLFPERPRKPGLAQARWDLKTMAVGQAAEQLADLGELVGREPFDAVVADAMALSAVFLAERDGVPLALLNCINFIGHSRDTAPGGLGLAPSSTPLGRIRNRLLTRLIHDVALRDVTRHLHGLRDRLGLRPTRASLFQLPFEVCSLFLQPTVPSFEYPRTDLPPQVRFIGALLPPAPTDWNRPVWWSKLDEDPPVVVVTQGTVATDFDDLLLPTVRGLADEEVLVIATTGRRPTENLGALPDNVIVEPFVPFGALLPRARVLVTNGGYGGIHVALSHGVPLVVAGKSEDKVETCARVGWTGVGIDLKTARAKPEAIRRAVRTVLADPSYTHRVRVLQAELARYDGPNRGAELLEHLVETPPPA